MTTSGFSNLIRMVAIDEDTRDASIFGLKMFVGLLMSCGGRLVSYSIRNSAPAKIEGIIVVAQGDADFERRLQCCSPDEKAAERVAD